MSRTSVLERFALQFTVGVAALVPLGAGGAGVIEGARFFGLVGSVSADSHMRYLSGLLLGIGLAFFSSIRRIETHTARFRILGGIVFLAGVGRLLTVLSNGMPEKAILFSLAMELVVTPAICVWQAHAANGD